MLSNHTGEEPVYKQLRELFLQQIEKGELAPGDRISNEHSLADQFQVSRTTIRRALHGLECDGLIVRFPGKGTFINSAVRSDRTPAAHPEKAHLTASPYCGLSGNGGEYRHLPERWD